MTRVIPFFMVFMLPALLGLGLEFGGIWTIIPLIVTFGMIPTLDAALELNRENQPESVGHQRVFDVPILLWVPVQILTTAYVIWRCTHGDLSGLEIAGVIASLGVINGAGGINIAHELMHRKPRLHRAGAEILMTSVSYTHFCVEHVLGHHRHVATPEDSASSRLGESFYRFYPRTVFGSLRSAWRLEGERCRARGISSWSLHNRRLRYPLVLVGVYAAVTVATGPLGLALFLAQGLLAFSLLEGINYIEHYGLARKQLASGRYERVRPEHSWNSAHLVSNYYLFNLARHSDHHYLASREYDRLRHHETAPQLPTGYAGMVLLALVPPAWFRVMNPRVEAWNARPGADSATATSDDAVVAA